MRTLSALAAAVLLGAMGAASAQTPPPPTPQGDAQAVEATVRGLFTDMAADRAPEAAQRLAAGFYAFDGGKRFEGDALVQLVEKLRQSGVVIRWNLGPVDVHVSGDLAWAAWDNHGSVGKPPAEAPVSWQESAVLKRENGAWRIVFLHSNRVDPPR